MSTTYAKTANKIEANLYGEFKEPLSSVCMHMDRCNENNMPFNSLTLDRMVSAIAIAEDLDVSPYYFYK